MTPDRNTVHLEVEEDNRKEAQLKTAHAQYLQGKISLVDLKREEEKIHPTFDLRRFARETG
ncbi:MAG: hypothetical protein ABSA43_01830 [Candidatus Microgenomates bacterium]|jgi:tRNA U38,U39,U40 pseudouridine synthase TruA